VFQTRGEQCKMLFTKKEEREKNIREGTRRSREKRERGETTLCLRPVGVKRGRGTHYRSPKPRRYCPGNGSEEAKRCV